MFASLQFICHRAISIVVFISPFAIYLCHFGLCVSFG